MPRKQLNGHFISLLQQSDNSNKQLPLSTIAWPYPHDGAFSAADSSILTTLISLLVPAVSETIDFMLQRTRF